jgi:hypothetical protein
MGKSAEVGCYLAGNSRVRAVRGAGWRAMRSTGNNIERENLRQGTGGKPLCKECARLN